MSVGSRLAQSQIRGNARRGLALSATGARAVRAIVLVVVGLMVTVGSASSDAYLHRGTTEGNAIVYRQPTGRGLATNVDLRGLTDTGLQSSVNFLTSAGYRYVRQEFSWSQFEPAPGQFAWAEYHRVVDALSTVNIDIVAVLVQTPVWARAPEMVNFPDAPPLVSETYLEMCAALRAEFPGLHVFQIGQRLDEPEYWGGKPLSRFTYRAMLGSAARGLDIAATDSMLVAGEVGLSPQIRQQGGDIAMLGRLLADPDIRGLLRVVSVAVDGGSQSPYDRRTNVGTDNLSRAVLVREAIDDVGASLMPIWFTHLGWTGSGGDRISLGDQARFVESGIERARSEWPWVGLIFNWTFGPVEGVEGSADLALLVNGSATPLLMAMTEFASSNFGSSITNGFVPPDARACDYSGNWQDQHLTDGIYRTVRDPAATVTCRFWGTGIAVYFRFSPDAGTANYAIDSSISDARRGDLSGQVFLTYRVSEAFEEPVELASGLDEGLHTLTISLVGDGEIVIGGYLVDRERPMIWPIAVLVSAGLVALFLGLRSLAFIAAEHVGMVSPRDASPGGTPLPIMPDWKPDPRFRRR